MQLRRVKSKGVRDERDRYSRVEEEEEEEEDGQGFCRDAPLAYQKYQYKIFFIIFYIL